MKYNLLFMTLLGILLIGIVSADYLPQKQNQNTTLIVGIDNATSCNLTYMKYPNGEKNIYNIAMTKTGVRDWNVVVTAGNFTQIGTTCAGVSCTDGVLITGDEFCGDVTPSGFTGTLGFYFILIALIAGLIILGFAAEEYWFLVLAGLGLIMIGIYSINNGVAGMKDMFMTYGIGIFEIAIGAIMGIGAAWYKIDSD
jgi:hypothetical protein